MNLNVHFLALKNQSETLNHNYQKNKSTVVLNITDASYLPMLKLLTVIFFP